MTAKRTDEARVDGAAALSTVDEDLPSWLVRAYSCCRIAKVALTIALLVLVAALDAVTGSELSFSVFYLVPVLFAVGLISRFAGRVTAVVSATTWGYLDVLLGVGYSAAWIPLWNSAVRLTFYLIIIELVNMLRLAHARQSVLARTDSLTGIANGRVFNEHLSRAITQCRRDGRPFTLTYLDLDGFKKVNDDLGHFEGDQVLRAVAATVGHDLRATDVVARLGGDEFAILMPETDLEQARGSLERIVARMALEVTDRWGVGVTFGAVTFVQPPDSLDCALRQADSIMYRGKKAGGTRMLQATWPAAYEWSAAESAGAQQGPS